MKKNRVFITGGASGLGFALAKCYAKNGWKVCIGDINDERGASAVNELKSVSSEIVYIHCDVTQEISLINIANSLQERWGGVDVVINNAGVAQAGPIEEVSLEDWQWIVNINLLGVVRGCKVFTPIFKRQGGGQFINIASMAGLIHAPMMSSYNATKAAVVALSETLKVELEPSNINVSVVCPAFFKTNLTETMRASNQDIDGMARKLVDKSKVSADTVAEMVFAGAQRGDFHIITHQREKAAWLLKRAVPFGVYSKLIGMEARRLFGSAHKNK